MTIRSKLLILLLSVSLVPLAAYFVFQISFAHIARNRVEKTLRSALEERARFELLQTIANYDEHLNISAQAVRYGLRHYGDQVQKVVLSIDMESQQSSGSHPLIRAPLQDLSPQADKYRFINPNRKRYNERPRYNCT